MAFKLETATHCRYCDPTPELENILSPQDRLIICFDYNFCPKCGRQLQYNSVMRCNPMAREVQQ